MAIFRLLARRFGRLLILSLLVCGVTASATSDFPEIVANNNRVPAGQLENGVLTVRIEAAMGNWYPEENDGPAFQSAAFREAGGKLSTPGPFIRVPEGTSIHVSIRNLLDQPLAMHGLHVRPYNGKDVLVIPPVKRGTLLSRRARRVPICTGQVELERTVCYIATLTMTN